MGPCWQLRNLMSDIKKMGKGTVVRMFITAVGILLLASGSARAQGVVLPLPPQDQQKITAQLWPGAVGKALPSQPIEDVSVYFPLNDRAHTFRVTSGPNTGNTQTLGLTKARRRSRVVSEIQGCDLDL
jgi:hypothetical protein